MQRPWAREHTQEGLLDEILGLVVRAAQGARDSVEDGAMGDQRSRVVDAYLA